MSEPSNPASSVLKSEALCHIRYALRIRILCITPKFVVTVYLVDVIPDFVSFFLSEAGSCGRKH